MQRNMNVRNFGLRSRDATRALIAAYQIKGNGYGANSTVKTALSHFTNHVKDHFGIKDLRDIKREHVLSYASMLNEKFEREELSASTAQNYLSPVNVALENARLDRVCRVDAVREAGLPTRSGIAVEDRSASKSQHDHAVNKLPDHLGIKLELQREIGLRFKESCLIDAQAALLQAQEKGKVTIENGTKGGRPREVAIHAPSQIKALQRAAEEQNKSRSLVPSEQTWSQYQSLSYREMINVGISFHQERHAYANARYTQLTGCKSPVQAKVPHREHIEHMAKTLNISIDRAKHLDIEARKKVSGELGHSRISITNNYLG